MILCISHMDNGQQLQLLTEAFRKYTAQDAFHVSKVKTRLYNDADYYVNAEEIDLDVQEIANAADFFILSELVPSDLRIRPFLERLGIYDKMTPHNTIIRTAGTAVRRYTYIYLLDWIQQDWMFAGPVYDWSLFSQIGRIAPVDYICPINKIPEPTPIEDKILICFAPTKRAKGVTEFTYAMNKLIEHYDDIEPVPIIKKTWQESLNIKKMCHITFDQFYIPSYANNCLEGLWLKHAVISRLADWVYVLRPDIPVFNVWNKEELYEVIKSLIEDRGQIKAVGDKGRAFVKKYHTPEKVIKQWELLVEHVSERDK